MKALGGGGSTYQYYGGNIPYVSDKEQQSNFRALSSLKTHNFNDNKSSDNYQPKRNSEMIQP